MIAVPRIRAQTFVKCISNARTRPALFSCRTDGGQLQEYVVKFCNQLQSRILCEFLAALLGSHLGLPIPPIAIVEIDPRVAAAIPYPEMRGLLAEDKGPHFGSQHKVGGYTPLPIPVPVNLMPEALDIFTFDMLIQNPDRSDKPGRGKPNLLFDGKQFWIFDHELAFSFLRDIGPSPPPWELRGLPFVKDHIFYDRLTRYAEKPGLSFEDFLSRFMTVSDSLLNEMMSVTPGNWRNTTNMDRIVSHLTTVRDNIQRFERGLLEALA